MAKVTQCMMTDCEFNEDEKCNQTEITINDCYECETYKEAD